MTRPAVLFSGGLDSAVLLAQAGAADENTQPVYIETGLAWEAPEQALAQALVRVISSRTRLAPMVTLQIDMRDVLPATHWPVRGEAPGFDTPDADVYIQGRNIVLLSKAAVYAARVGLHRLQIGTLAGNPFPDATLEFFEAIGRGFALGLGTSMVVEAPFITFRKTDVIRLGASLGVPFELTLSCMQPVRDLHCGRCSKCRERRDGFREAGIEDPASYAVQPIR